jgi:hypothetical protein
MVETGSLDTLDRGSKMSGIRRLEREWESFYEWFVLLESSLIAASLAIL